MTVRVTTVCHGHAGTSDLTKVPAISGHFDSEVLFCLDHSYVVGNLCELALFTAWYQLRHNGLVKVPDHTLQVGCLKRMR